MTNNQKYKIEACGHIESAEQLKQLQADMRRLPNFSGKGFVAEGVITRDYWALLKDRKTGELAAYFGTMRGFAVWGSEPVQVEEKIRSFNPTTYSGTIQ